MDVRPVFCESWQIACRPENTQLGVFPQLQTGARLPDAICNNTGSLGSAWFTFFLLTFIKTVISAN